MSGVGSRRKDQVRTYFEIGEDPGSSEEICCVLAVLSGNNAATTETERGDLQTFETQGLVPNEWDLRKEEDFLSGFDNLLSNRLTQHGSTHAELHRVKRFYWSPEWRGRRDRSASVRYRAKEWSFCGKGVISNQYVTISCRKMDSRIQHRFSPLRTVNLSDRLVDISLWTPRNSWSTSLNNADDVYAMMSIDI